MNRILVVLCLIGRLIVSMTNRIACNLVELIESVGIIGTKQLIRMISRD